MRAIAHLSAKRAMRSRGNGSRFHHLCIAAPSIGARFRRQILSTDDIPGQLSRALPTKFSAPFNRLYLELLAQREILDYAFDSGCNCLAVERINQTGLLCLPPPAERYCWKQQVLCHMPSLPTQAVRSLRKAKRMRAPKLRCTVLADRNPQRSL